MFRSQKEQVFSKFQKAQLLIDDEPFKRVPASALTRKPATISPSPIVSVRPQNAAAAKRIYIASTPSKTAVAASKQPTPNEQQELFATEKVACQPADKTAKMRFCQAQCPVISLFPIKESTVPPVVKSKTFVSVSPLKKTATVTRISPTASIQRQPFQCASFGCSTYSATRRPNSHCQSGIFDYHLSHAEQLNFGRSLEAMKSVSPAELKLLRSDQRATYLETHYECVTTDKRCNYPEAMSWRYGWFHRLGDRAN